jgi:Tol biopolymer transport system component
MEKIYRLALVATLVTLMHSVFAQPSLTGKIVYHTYSDYNAWDSRIYVLDLSTGSRTNISAGWNIDHEMNAHWSPDGTRLVFMGDVAGEPRNWDIFIWTVGTSQPVNLTNGGGRDEDPKFSPDGQRIVFKRDNDLWQMQLNGAIINNVTNTPNIEESMPYYTADGGSILYAPGVGAGSDIYRINTNGTGAQALVAQPNVQEYFPITRDNNSFFYTAWRNASNLNDQIYLKPYNGSATLLPFNTSDANYSDAYAVGSQYVLFSSTRSGGKGGYDLYIANITSGQTWSLDSYNSSVNSSGHDLAAVYHSSGTPPPPPTQSPYGGSAWGIPGKIESENYDNGGQGVAYNDNTAGNSGAVYRNDGVDIEGTTDTGGGYNVGYIATGEWLEYTVNVTTSGTYTLQARVAAAAAGGRLHVEMDGVNVSGSVTVPNTGGWQTWQTVSVTTTSIGSGQKVMRLYVDAGGFNINYLNFSTSGGGGQTPYGGTAWNVPGKIEAENYDNGGQSVAYFDLTTGNSGGVYRSNDVDLEGCSDTGGGYDVGGINTNEWLEYTINVGSSSTYSVSLRVATAQAGGRVRVEINGASVGTVNIPNTGGWQTWQTVSFTSSSISSGQKVLRLFFEVGNFNLNHITFSSGGGGRMITSTLETTEDDVTPETSKILCYPNPVRDITTVKVEVSKPGRTEVSLLGVTGKKVNIYEGDLAVGSHEFQYDARNLKPGFYLLNVSGVGTRAASKLIKLD